MNRNLNNVVELFLQQTAAGRQAIAVEQDGKQYSYAQLHHDVEHVARVLHQHGVRAGDIIGISISRSYEMIVGVLGILKAGAAYLPLDPTYPAERLHYMVEQSQARGVLTETALQFLYQDLGTTVLLYSQLMAERAIAQPVVQPLGADALAYIIYTSGSTGKPKGVAMNHRALTNLIQWQMQESGLGLGARTIQYTPLGFDVSFQEIFATLCSGGTLYIVQEDVRLDPLQLLRFLQEKRIERIFLPFVALQYLSEAAPALYPQYLKEVITAGEQLQITPAIRNLFQNIPAARLWNHYGPSETHVATSYPLPSDVSRWETLPPIGQPIAQSKIFVLNEALQPVSQGAEGDIFIGGACLANGYIHRGDLTAERFVTLPGLGRLYRTGDLGRFRIDGQLEYLGRLDSQVKLHGYRIELGEVEVQLASLIGVKQAVATIWTHKSGHKQLIAYVEMQPTSTIQVSQWREQLAQTLPDYMVPSLFIKVDSLPRTPSGKIDRRKLPEPHHQRPELATPFMAPQTPTQRQLAQLWQELLQLEQVGIDDSFFELGGSSILALRFIATLRQQAAIELPVVQVFERSTIRKLAAFIDGDQTSSTLKDSAERWKQRQHTGESGVAIIGMAGRFPGAANIAEFWRNICAGIESTEFFKAEDIAADQRPTDTQQVFARGIVHDSDKFDHQFFGFSPREAAVMDPQQRLFLETAWLALEDAGVVPEQYRGLIGVFAGMANNTYFNQVVAKHPDVLRQFGEFNAMLLNEKDYLATRVAHKLNLHGPALSVYTGCSTSLVAVIQACQNLLGGYCDVALAGGVSVQVPERTGYHYEEGGIFSQDGHCKPFAADATGTVFSDGVGAVVLKRLADAQRDGDPIYAVIRGLGMNNDGADKISFSAPSVDGQAKAVAMALASADISAASIGYIEAHGTATPLGDPVEIAALTKAFQLTTDKKQFCAIGSVKGNFGHLTAAAGIVGLIKTALALKHKVLPPTLHAETLNPRIDFAQTPFAVQTKLSDWPQGATPRRAGVSSFGIGGTNAHIVLEEADVPTSVATSDEDYQVLLLSARSESALAAQQAQLQMHLAQSAAPLSATAYTLHQGRQHFNYRRFVVAKNSSDAVSQLASDSLSSKNVTAAAPVYFMFPGQGAQYLGMGADIYQREPVFRQAVDDCAKILRPYLGCDLRDILFAKNAPHSEVMLNQTYYTQPAIFVVSYALACLWNSWGVNPQALIGHSVGEFVAATLAGVFRLEDALYLVSCRAALVNEMPVGQMLAVQRDAQSIREVLPVELDIAAINAPELTVVAGESRAVEAFYHKISASGWSAKPLTTSHAFHSRMVEPVVASFITEVKKFQLHAPRVPIVSTVTGEWLTAEQAQSPAYWGQHLRETVRFEPAFATLVREGSPILLDVGPRGTMSALARLQPQANTPVVASMGGRAYQGQEYQHLLQAVGQLWSQGVTVNGEAFYQHRPRVKISLPTYPFARTRHWLESAAVAAPVSTARVAPLEPARLTKTDLLTQLCRVMEEATGLTLRDSDPQATFMALGIDSLALTQIALTIKNKFGVPLTFRLLMEKYSSLHLLAEYVEQALPPVVVKSAVEAAPPVAENNETQAFLRQQLQMMREQLELLTRLAEVNAGSEAPASAPMVDPLASARVGAALLSGAVPTTVPQLEMWSAAQSGQDASCAYNESVSIRLSGSLQVASMQLALQDLVARHDSLRMTFSHDGQSAFIQGAKPFNVAVKDLTDKAAGEKAASLSRFTQAEVEQPFDLANGPLFRAHIFILEPDSFVVVMTVHHLVCDGWSAAILIQELGQLYTARTRGVAAQLPAAPSYAAFAAMLRGEKAQAERQSSEQYWHDLFKQGVPQLDFPFEKKRPAHRSYRAERLDWTIAPELKVQLQEFAAAHNLSIFVTLFAAFAVWLQRLSGQQEFVVGVPYAGQTVHGMRRLVGYAVNLLPIYNVVQDQQSFVEHARTLQSTMLDAHEHQHISLGRLLQILRVKRDLSRPPLVSVMFNVDQKLSPKELDFADCEVRYDVNPRSFENFDFFVNIAEFAGSMTIMCQYNTDLMSQEGMRAYLKIFENILRNVVAQPQRPMASLPILDAEQERVQLADMNQTAMTYPRHLSVQQLFEQSVQENPQKVAVHFGFQSLSYAELNRRSNQLAHYLRAQGVRGGHLIGLAVDRSLDMLVSMLGILKAGAAYVPIDPAYPVERIHFMIEHARLRLCITHKVNLATLALKHVPVVVLDRDHAAISQCATHNVTADDIHSENPAYVIYTSGSTGKPKGVQVPHRAVVNFLHSMSLEPGITAQDRLLALTTLSFDIAVLELYLPLVKGAEVIIASRDEALDGVQLSSLIARHRISMMQATPATWRMLIASGWQGEPRLTALCGGEALSHDLVRELLPRVKALWNMYGPTETTVWSSCHRVHSVDAPIVVGKPIANTQIFILDASMQPVPYGVRGEIYIGGDGVTQGYLHRPDLTSERFIEAPNHLGIAGLLYKTGDIGRRTFGGDIEFLQRNDTQVKVRGFRIELNEIQTILGQHPHIAQAVVIVHTDRTDEKRLVAYVQVAAGFSFNKTAIVAHMQAHLPHYMVARLIVQVAKFPLLPNGKLNYQALPAPEYEDVKSGSEAALVPRTFAEKSIAAIWAELLHQQDIRTSDNFFDLGGHSLLLMQVLQRIQAQTGQRPPLSLFLTNTLEQLAPHCFYQEPVRERSLPQVAVEKHWEPHFFGDAAAPLFGVYHSPQRARLQNEAVLLCYPGSEEYMRTHWSFRQLASQLARAGFPVLRFDYYGTGDSAGMTGTGDVAQWVDDIVTATAFLKSFSGAAKVHIVGLRLGAALASSAIDRGFEVGKLVLWDPVIQGPTYLRETYQMVKDLALHEKHLPPFMSKRDLSRFMESSGFPISRSYKDQVARLSLANHSWVAAEQVHLVTTQLSDEIRALQQKIIYDNGSVHQVDENCEWGHFHKLRLTLFANKALQSIVRILTGGEA